MGFIYPFKLARYLNIIILWLLVSGIIFAMSIDVLAQPDTSAKLLQAIDFSKGWQYRIGDSPIDSTGKPMWIFDNADSPEWKAFDLSSHLLNIKEDQHIIWLRLKLSYDTTLENPGIYFRTPHQNFESYIAGNLVYKSGKIDTTGKAKSYNNGWSIIPLSSSFHNEFLYLRIYSHSSGYLGILNDVQISSIRPLVMNIVENNCVQIILAFFFVFIGFASLILFFIRKMEDKSLLSLSLFSSSLGLSTLATAQINYLFTNIPVIFWFYSEIFSNILIVVGICAYIQQVFDRDYNPIYKYLWQGYLFFIPFSLILDSSDLVSLLYTSNLFYILVLITIPIVLKLPLKACKKGDSNAKTVTFGIVCSSLTALYDIFGYIFKVIPWSRFTFAYGMLIFIITLVIVSSRRFIEVYDKLRMYSEEIEAKNISLNKTWEELKISRDQASEKNYTLEERTAELEATNTELLVLLEWLQHTQEQLVQSEKMAALGGLVAGVAHEINTPLGISITATSFLQKQTKEFSDLYISGKMKRADLENYINATTETIGMIMSNMQKASGFVKSFKQVAVDQSSQEKRKFKVKSYIDEVLLSLKPKLKKVKHTITVNCGDDLEIDSYPGALSQIITNLVMNSLMHAYDDDNDGNIIIDVHTKDKRLIFKYSDDGKGIDTHIINKIFDPFFTTKRGHGGTGLGLHIVYNLVKQTFSGTIICESELGKGTTFIMEFPIREEISYD